MKNWKAIQEIIATPVTGVGLLWRGETIVLYLAILPCSRHPLFLLPSLSRFLLPACLCAYVLWVWHSSFPAGHVLSPGPLIVSSLGPACIGCLWPSIAAMAGMVVTQCKAWRTTLLRRSCVTGFLASLVLTWWVSWRHYWDLGQAKK